MVLSLASRTAALVRHVDVTQILRRTDSGIYLGHSADLGWGRVYGGQTMAQGLAAAQSLVGEGPAGEGRRVHQLSCHFLRPGDVKKDVEVEADLLSDGRSFAVAHVRAIQHGKAILAMTASFQTPEAGMSHSFQHRADQGGPALRQEWGKPEDLVSIHDLMKPYVEGIPKQLRPLYQVQQPIDVR